MTSLSDKNAVKVVIGFDNGDVQTLTGKPAQEWMEHINGLSMFYHVHGGTFPTLPWEHKNVNAED